MGTAIPPRRNAQTVAEEENSVVESGKMVGDDEIDSDH